MNFLKVNYRKIHLKRQNETDTNVVVVQHCITIYSRVTYSYRGIVHRLVEMVVVNQTKIIVISQ